MTLGWQNASGQTRPLRCAHRTAGRTWPRVAVHCDTWGRSAQTAIRTPDRTSRSLGFRARTVDTSSKPRLKEMSVLLPLHSTISIGAEELGYQARTPRIDSCCIATGLLGRGPDWGQGLSSSTGANRLNPCLLYLRFQACQ